VRVLRSLAWTILLLACGALEVEAAGKYPSGPIDIVVPFNAGAATDTLTRLVAEELSKKWGQPVNVVNKPGGNTVIGTHAVMSAGPDGYTLLADSIGSSSGQIGLKGVPYDVLKRTFIAMSVVVPQVIICSVASPWQSLKDLAEAGKKDPASVVWGSAAAGRGGSDIVQLQLFDAAGIDVPKARRVDFNGSAAAINALAGGHVKLHAASPGAVAPAVQSGKARALGVTTPKRTTLLPDVPTTREAGFPAVDYTYWVGISGPPGMSAADRDAIAKAVQDIVKDPSVVDRLSRRFDAVPAFLGPEPFRKFVTDEAQRIARLERLMTGGQ
jgi:putative tricarboxylic transport membrane protein